MIELAPEDQWLSLKDVERECRIPYNTLYLDMRKRKLRAVNRCDPPGVRWMTTVAWVSEYMHRREGNPRR